ncbi:MAG: hypothetical protein EBS53_15260 [Bacteroidetes bacterium]|nr:hypothetical protein [Bacteroidota bacterium]
MNWANIVPMVFPILVAAVGWMITSVNSLQSDLIDIKSKMPALISPQGVPTDSPISAAARAQMKEDLVTRIQELEVRVRLLEERTKEHR